MRDAHEEDPKKPRPVSVGRKGDNAAEAQEHGLTEVGPRAHRTRRYRHVHVSS